ncbi:SMI1/KNR4 family protein [Aquimarina aquimarini]|uniref:SMI1/KNR4 family protein n=1 Tax=Aquimarina aquimarini TaxID=1191734 RepID=UPI000D558E46|nr:SMI1/KNR4 family protein [Aquimarina aquimarini]
MKLEFYKKLTNGGFKVVKNLKEFEISKKILERYVNLPAEYLIFLRGFESITNMSDTIWFNSNNDFNAESDNEFKWNEFELLSLEWSEDDDDELINIVDFWKNHIPIILSVKDGFQFLAICLENEKYGEIVHGREPVFEDVTKICNSFNELIYLFEKKEIENII